jgi:hypothetical protein
MWLDRIGRCFTRGLGRMLDGRGRRRRRMGGFGLALAEAGKILVREHQIKVPADQSGLICTDRTGRLTQLEEPLEPKAKISALHVNSCGGHRAGLPLVQQPPPARQLAARL